MKKLFLLLAVFGLLFTACETSGDDVVSEEIATIQLQKSSITFDDSAGQQKVSFSVSTDWTAEIIDENDKEWLSISRKSGSASDNASIIIRVKENVTSDERTATIRIKAGTKQKSIKIKQKQKEDFYFLNNTDTYYTITADGGKIDVAFETICNWKITTNASWLIISETEGTRGTVDFFITVNPNNTNKERSGTVTISLDNGKTFYIKVTQELNSKIPQLVCKPNEILYTTKFGTIIEKNFMGNTGFGDSNATKCVECGYENGYGYIRFNHEVTRIPAEAFKNCTSLEYIYLPDGVTKIGEAAFLGCTSLTSFYGKFASSDNRCLIVDGVLNSFAPANLTSYTIPDSVTSIGGSAFSGCTALTSITIPDSVTSIGYSAFLGCTGELIINSKIVETDYDYYNRPSYKGWLSGAKFTKLTIGDSVTKISDYVFYNCTSLKSITIPDSVTEIGREAFSGCTGELIINSKIIETDYHYDNRPSYKGWLRDAEFTKLTIGDSVTKIGKYAFEDCSSLTSVTIGDSVTSIGWRAFAGCTSLTSGTIPDSVTEIEWKAFYDCSSLTSFYGKFASSDNRCLIIDGVLNSFAPANLTSYTIPDSVTSIGDGAFLVCTSLTSITIPDSVTEIGMEAFEGCSSLTSITIPDSVTEIGHEAFRGCTSLTSITIPDSVTEIESSAFDGCTSLTSITIGNGVTSIGWCAFSDCKSLTEVYCKPTTPPAGGDYMFYNNTSGRKIYVPRNSVDAYKTAEYWSDYASYIVGYDF